MDSPLRSGSNPAARRRTWQAYQRWLAMLDQQQLASHLTEINAQLQSQATARILSTSQALSDYRQTVDRPVVSSTPTASPSSLMDRAREPFPGSPAPDALSLLSSSQRLGPRLAARLVLASARAAARKDEG
jgi:hypothetical protein